MFFTKKKPELQPTVDLYDKTTFIARTLLVKELPQHNAQHHILYTANTQLIYYKELAETHRQQAFSTSALSAFHRQVYEQLTKKQQQLQLIIDTYMELHLDVPREAYNHRLRFDDQPIDLVYDELQRMQQYHLSSEQEPSFWQAIKEHIFPTFAKLVP